MLVFLADVGRGDVALLRQDLDNEALVLVAHEHAAVLQRQLLRGARVLELADAGGVLGREEDEAALRVRAARRPCRKEGILFVRY